MKAIGRRRFVFTFAMIVVGFQVFSLGSFFILSSPNPPLTLIILAGIGTVGLASLPWVRASHARMRLNHPRKAYEKRLCPCCGAGPLQIRSWRQHPSVRYGRCPVCSAYFCQNNLGPWKSDVNGECELIFHGGSLPTSTWFDPQKVQADSSTVGELLRSKRDGDLDRLGEAPPPSPYQTAAPGLRSKPKVLGEGETIYSRLLKNKFRRGWSPSSTEPSEPAPTLYDHWLDGGPG